MQEQTHDDEAVFDEEEENLGGHQDESVGDALSSTQPPEQYNDGGITIDGIASEQWVESADVVAETGEDHDAEEGTYDECYATTGGEAETAETDAYAYAEEEYGEETTEYATAEDGGQGDYSAEAAIEESAYATTEEVYGGEEGEGAEAGVHDAEGYGGEVVEQSYDASNGHEMTTKEEAAAPSAAYETDEAFVSESYGDEEGRAETDNYDAAEGVGGEDDQHFTEDVPAADPAVYEAYGAAFGDEDGGGAVEESAAAESEQPVTAAKYDEYSLPTAAEPIKYDTLGLKQDELYDIQQAAQGGGGMASPPAAGRRDSPRDRVTVAAAVGGGAVAASAGTTKSDGQPVLMGSSSGLKSSRSSHSVMSEAEKAIFLEDHRSTSGAVIVNLDDAADGAAGVDEDKIFFDDEFIVNVDDEATPLVAEKTPTKAGKAMAGLGWMWGAGQKSAADARGGLLYDDDDEDDGLENDGLDSMVYGKAGACNCFGILLTVAFLAAQLSFFGFYLYKLSGHSFGDHPIREFSYNWGFTIFQLRKLHIWRIFSSLLVHTNLIHIMLNTLSFIQSSVYFTNSCKGSMLLICIYILCGVAGCFANGYHACQVVTGSGGATLGLTTFLLLRQHLVGRRSVDWLHFMTFGLFVAQVLLEPHLATAAGGIYIGAMLALVLSYRRRRKQRCALLLLVIGIVGIASTIALSIIFTGFMNKEVLNCPLDDHKRFGTVGLMTDHHISLMGT